MRNRITYLFLMIFLLTSCLQNGGGLALLNEPDQTEREPEFDQVASIETRADGFGTSIGDHTLVAGTSISLYAVARNRNGSFLGSVDVEWSVPNTLGTFSQSVGSSSTFIAQKVGTEVITATNTAFARGETGAIRVTPGTPTKILVATAANGDGGAVLDETLTVGETLSLFAIAADNYDNYVGNIAVNWSVPNSLGTFSSSYTSSVTFSATGTGVEKVLANHASLIDDETGNISVVSLPPSAFVIVDPTDSTVGVATTVTVEAHDANGNVVTDYNGAVTLNADGNAIGSGLVLITNGVGTILINDNVAEIVNLSLQDSSSTGIAVTSTQGLLFSNGSLVFDVQPSTTTIAGVDLLTQPIVSIRDASNNVLTSASDLIELEAYTDSTCTTSSDISLRAVSTTAILGVATFSGVDHTKAETIYIRASAAGVGPTCSNAITVSPAAANKLAFTQQPSDVAGIATNFLENPQVSILDEFDNLTTSTVSIQLSPFTDLSCSSTGGGTLSAAANPMSAASGVASFTNVQYSAPGALYIQASSAGLTSACSDLITINVGAPAKLAFVTQPSTTAVAGINFTIMPVVEIQDSTGSIADSSTDTISITAFTDSSCVTPSTGTFSNNSMNAVAGSASFTGVNHQKAETIYLKAVSGALTSDCSEAVVVDSNVAHKLAFSTQPDQPVVDILDEYDNLVSSATNSITLSPYTNSSCSSASGASLAVSSNPLAASSGQASFGKIAHNSGNFYIKAAASGLLPACSNVFEFEDRAVAFNIEAPDRWDRDAYVEVTIKALKFDMTTVDTNFNGTVDLTATANVQDEGQVTLTNGIGTISIKDFFTETSNLGLANSSDSSLAVTDTHDIEFVMATVHELRIEDPIDVQAGNPATVEIKAYSEFGTHITSFNGNVQLDLGPSGTNASASGGGVISISSGTGSITVNDTSIEVVDLSLSHVDSSTSGIEISSAQDLEFLPLPVDHFEIVLSDMEVTAGSEFVDATIVAKDAFDNTVLGYTGTITFISSDSSGLIPSNYTFLDSDNGAKVFTNAISFAVTSSCSEKITVEDNSDDTIKGVVAGIKVMPSGGSVAPSNLEVHKHVRGAVDITWDATPMDKVIIEYDSGSSTWVELGQRDGCDGHFRVPSIGSSAIDLRLKSEHESSSSGYNAISVSGVSTVYNTDLSSTTHTIAVKNLYQSGLGSYNTSYGSNINTEDHAGLLVMNTGASGEIKISNIFGTSSYLYDYTTDPSTGWAAISSFSGNGLSGRVRKWNIINDLDDYKTIYVKSYVSNSDTGIRGIASVAPTQTNIGLNIGTKCSTLVSGNAGSCTHTAPYSKTVTFSSTKTVGKYQCRVTPLFASKDDTPQATDWGDCDNSAGTSGSHTVNTSNGCRVWKLEVRGVLADGSTSEIKPTFCHKTQRFYLQSSSCSGSGDSRSCTTSRRIEKNALTFEEEENQY